MSVSKSKFYSANSKQSRTTIPIQIQVEIVNHVMLLILYAIVTIVLWKIKAEKFLCASVAVSVCFFI